MLPQGRRASIEAAKAALASLADELPAMLLDSLQDQLSRLRALDEEIARIEQRILNWRRNDDACLRISEIPGVGKNVSLGAGVCRLSRSRAAAERLGRQDQARWDQQTRRRLSADAADPRRAIGHLELKALAGAFASDVVPTTNERRCCCTRKQDGANNLGAAGVWPNV